MEKIDRELLIKEISSRLPYEVKAQVLGWDEEKGEVEVPLRIYSINTDGYVYFETNNYDVNYLRVDDCLLFLRPMSSMTEEEREELSDYLCEQVMSNKIGITIPPNPTQGKGIPFIWMGDCMEWLNAHHFDYHGLIQKGLAIEAPKDMYK